MHIKIPRSLDATLHPPINLPHSPLQLWGHATPPASTADQVSLNICLGVLLFDFREQLGLQMDYGAAVSLFFFFFLCCCCALKLLGCPLTLLWMSVRHAWILQLPPQNVPKSWMISSHVVVCCVSAVCFFFYLLPCLFLFSAYSSSTTAYSPHHHDTETDSSGAPLLLWSHRRHRITSTESDVAN